MQIDEIILNIELSGQNHVSDYNVTSNAQYGRWDTEKTGLFKYLYTRNPRTGLACTKKIIVFI